jgi:chemotaxis protein MotB
MGQDQPVIIIKKKKGGHGGHHGGAWKVAYADFVTAMMAFFLVMWLVAQSKPVKAAIGGYFRDPGIFDQAKSNGPIAGGNGGILPDGNGQKSSTLPDEEDAETALKHAAERIHERLMQGADFRAMRDQVAIEMTAEGLRVQLLESARMSFFDSGSATLKGESVKLLQLIAGELGKQPNEITIEGHTDSRPYSNGKNYTNWELSADRANAARRVMESQLRPHQLNAIRGYADTQLRFPDDPFDAKNRRISIVVRNQGGHAQPSADGQAGPAKGGDKADKPGEKSADAHAETTGGAGGEKDAGMRRDKVGEAHAEKTVEKGSEGAGKKAAR